MCQIGLVGINYIKIYYRAYILYSIITAFIRKLIIKKSGKRIAPTVLKSEFHPLQMGFGIPYK
jgi:hypothetical protein